ncbi:sugar transferase [Carnobacterium funditum]|uniref:sugar transferase n=1 Tax=Carnobacterium funditum TaxID=2752 RepID=UPI0005549636|nr:sugar transferase [Carnobacterium funditum]
MYEHYIKHDLDVLFALVLIIITSPILIISALFIRYETKGPVFFKQNRIGKNCREFNIYKFRTMRIETVMNDQLLTDAQRITRVGAFLRKTSIDELPQLFNILMGEMSFIGPRPLLPQYLELYDQKQLRRHEVMSGISGWAQVNGRNTISWEDKFKLDVYYVNHVCLKLDIKILFSTLYKVIGRKNIDCSVNETMTYFKGETK